MLKIFIYIPHLFANLQIRQRYTYIYKDIVVVLNIKNITVYIVIKFTCIIACFVPISVPDMSVGISIFVVTVPALFPQLLSSRFLAKLSCNFNIIIELITVEKCTRISCILC